MHLDPEHLRQGLIWFIILASSVALHEYGHAKAADLLGDPLPRMQGRVTLNPLVHLDPIGTVLVPLLIIVLNPAIQIMGWGRPVQVSLMNPKTRIRDDVLSTLAGPGMNFLISLIAAIATGLLLRINPEAAQKFWPLLKDIIWINCGLIAFNLIPLPPLDGSRIVRYVVGMSEETFVRISMFSQIVLLILINNLQFQMLLGNLIAWVAQPFMHLIKIISGG